MLDLISDGLLEKLFRLLLIYGFCEMLAIIAAILEIWNSKLAARADNNILYPRFIITTCQVDR
ncbi:hypothetical protein X798_03623 [Onchocerca flexuosa]|uniref:Uncharacterized protein n=1 Tax=Onchocerca flexuosa TaxID=387005 RepID=A0A238BVG3_9BILA|nr:hypothetical protein X798_03623 [Onchocerca flexuosa]